MRSNFGTNAWRAALLLALIALAQGYNKVLLRDLSTLTLRKGRMTTGRRSSPVPQMTCVGSRYCGSAFEPDTIQCTNKGSDGHDVQWECKADLDSGLRFGATDVICEGYDYPEDPYVLGGSCGIEYALKGNPSGGNSNHRSSQGYHYDTYSHSSSSSSWSFSDILTYMIVGYFIYKTLGWIFSSDNNPPNQANRGNPPPAYGTGDGYGGPGGGYGGGGGGGGGYGGGGATQHPNNNNNFWWGMMAGGGLANMFRPRTYDPYGYNAGYGHDYGYRRPAFGRQRVHTTHHHRAAPAATNRTATAFAGTRRR